MRDESGFVEFAQTSRARLRRTAYLLCGDWDRASDHVQEGLIRVYVAWPRLEKAGREYAYARKAVVSAVLDHGRRRSSREMPSISGEPDDTRADRGDLAEQVTSRAALMAALPDPSAPATFRKRPVPSFCSNRSELELMIEPDTEHSRMSLSPSRS